MAIRLSNSGRKLVHAFVKTVLDEMKRDRIDRTIGSDVLTLAILFAASGHQVEFEDYVRKPLEDILRDHFGN